MRQMLLIFAAALFFINAQAQSTNPKYDKQLADSLGGDDYGMKLYVLVILKTGTNTSASKQLTDSLFRGHLENINRLAAENKLVVAGPLKKNEKAYRGIFILDVRSIAEAKELLKTDPAVEQKLLDAELFEWYGSAALPVYLKQHEKIEKKSF
ncbi:YciI family protein [Flavihumibacter solisilvae]|uniref:YCII-related domain-containing protein n=1 Tax=Flavihumibacter solisilvae TaxID=1349421 RepID=A0A0C1ISJ1_9BACT|nr:YciI family protein [Flavihumibacter solisilvae]KIC93414.1 hypothetical protein OI18_16685 [Flavihumibacter solisilvae]